jgi:hypothetical protein
MIKENIQRILNELPDGVELVVAAKTRTPKEIQEAAEAGINIIGENYVQEALKAIEGVGRSVSWHFIGHLQKNKVRKAVSIFDMIQTVDSFELAKEIDKACRSMDKVMPILVEINSGREAQKFGVMPEDTLELVEHIGSLQNIRCMGLMTMGPRFGDPEDSRSYFVETRRLYDRLKNLNLPNIEMKYLSMGMTNSYLVAIQEGANMVRIGTKIFGEREYV